MIYYVLVDVEKSMGFRQDFESVHVGFGFVAGEADNTGVFGRVATVVVYAVNGGGLRVWKVFACSACDVGWWAEGNRADGATAMEIKVGFC
jgi:hypothetical protein